MKTVFANPHISHRTLDEHPVPDSVLRIAEQYDPEDPIGYSGDYSSSYLPGNWDLIRKRRWGNPSNN